MAVTEEYIKNESLIIETSDDKMEAVIYFVPSEGDGLPLTENDIRKAIADEKIIFGIKDILINQLSNERAYHVGYIIAEGESPKEGQKAEIIYHFDLGGNKPRPKINENGSVNHHDLGILKLCKAEDVLASIDYSDISVLGRDIYGNSLYPEAGRQTLSLLQGDNTRVSEDGQSLIAASDGLVVMRPGKISISKSIVINGDINSATGDIVFSGMVNVKGSIRNGYTVKAETGITVEGVVEAARLETAGDIILENGVRGSNKAVICAGGSIKANFLESCAVSAQGDITADSILHSQIICGGSLTLKGRHGVLVGGKAVVKNCINAESIGSAVSTPTELYVGYAPDTMRLYQELLDEYEETVKRYDEINLTVNSLQSRISLKDDKKKILLKLLHTKFLLRKKLKELRVRFDNILPEMDSHNGIVKARLIVHFGVKALIGNAVIYIRDDLANCVLTNVNGKINIGVNG